MVKGAGTPTRSEKLVLELRRGALVLATLAQLEAPRYGYSLLRHLAERGLEIEPGTLYPLLRRLEEQGLLDSDWRVDGPRPRKYYTLNEPGRQVLTELEEQWRDLVQVVSDLLAAREGED